MDSWLTLENELSKEATYWRSKTLLGRGGWVESRRVKEPSTTRLTVPDFTVVGLVSRLSLADHLAWPIFGLTQSFLLAWASLSQERFSVKDSGRLAGQMGWHLLHPPFLPTQILPVSFQWHLPALYGDHLSWDNSGKWLSSLATAGSFSQHSLTQPYMASLLDFNGKWRPTTLTVKRSTFPGLSCEVMMEVRSLFLLNR